MLNLDTCPLSVLVAEFNKLTGQSVKKFSDRKTAIRRLAPYLKKAPSSPPKGRKSSIAHLSIVVKMNGNTRREGSNRYARLQALLTSKTVAEAQSKVPGINARAIAREVAAGSIAVS